MRIGRGVDKNENRAGLLSKLGPIPDLSLVLD